MALDPKDNKGRSPEESEKFGRNRPGVYLHKATGKTMTVTTTPAADAMAMQGWEFQRAATADDLKPKPAEEPDSKAPEKDLRAQLKESEKAKELAEKAAADAKAKQEEAEQQAGIAKADAVTAAQKAADETKAREEAEAATEKAKADADAAQKLAEEAEAKAQAATGDQTNGGKKEGK